MLRHQDYLDISQASDKQSFDRLLVKFAQSLEFSIVSAALVVEHPGTHPVFVMTGNTPDGFVEASKSLADSRRDPVLKRMKRLNVPFIYDQALYVKESAGDLWEQQAVFGDDPWPYTLEENRVNLEVAVRYAYQEGMIAQQPRIEELFVPSTLLAAGHYIE